VADLLKYLSPANISYDNKNRRKYFLKVPVALIDPNPFNARHIYLAERVKQLGADIAATGQLQPGVATIRDGRFVLAAAHYRWKGILHAKLPSMDLMVHEELTDQELYEISYKENAEREDQSPLDNALAWRQLIEDQVYANESAIAEATGMSLPNVNKTMAILKLSKPILDLVGQRPADYPLSSLYELVQLETAAGQKIALEMAQRVGNGEVGRDAITELRQRYQDPKKERKAKENSRQYKINDSNGKQKGILKEWDSGKVVLEIQCLEQKEREQIVRDLKQRFNLGE
jgi:ParB family chromosome partitioning protein